MTARQFQFSQGDETWKALRQRFTKSVPGKYSSLYWLNYELRGLSKAVPMTYRTHWAMCMFAEGMTGIRDIDEARVKMILVPRGVGKSALVTAGLALQKLLVHDDYAVGIANEKQSLSEGFLASIKMELEQNELLKALFPERIPPDLKKTTWASDRIVVPRTRPRPVSPSVLAAGVNATVTGVHMDLWILDDVISQNAAENARAGSFTEIDSTNRWVERLEPLLCAPKGDPIVVIGTRWWIGDTYEWMEGTEDIPGIWGGGEKRKTYNWQVTLPDGTRQTHKVYRRGELAVFKRSAIDEAGNSIFPERLPLDALEKMQRANPAFFAGQYLLEPAAGGAGEFDEKNLRSYQFENEFLRFMGKDLKVKFVPRDKLTILISLDPAFSKKSDAARTAIPVVGIYGDDVFLLEDFAERGLSVPDMINKVLDFSLRFGQPHKIFVETITAQAAIEEPLREAFNRSGLPYVQIEPISSHKGLAKGARIRALDNVFRSGHFYCRGDQTKFKQEYVSFPQGGLVDILDALSFQSDTWMKMARQNSPYAQNNEGYYNTVQADLARLRANVSRAGGY